MSRSCQVEFEAQGAEARELEAKAGQPDLAQPVRVFRPGGARSPSEVMVSFINAHRDEYGVKPICAQLPIAPSTNYEYKARERDPGRWPLRVRRDLQPQGEIRQVCDANLQVYGARKECRQLNREQIAVARCTVERLMWVLGLHGPVRGKTWRTTIADDAAAHPNDLVQRQL